MPDNMSYCGLVHHHVHLFITGEAELPACTASQPTAVMSLFYWFTLRGLYRARICSINCMYKHWTATKLQQITDIDQYSGIGQVVRYSIFNSQFLLEKWMKIVWPHESPFLSNQVDGQVCMLFTCVREGSRMHYGKRQTSSDSVMVLLGKPWDSCGCIQHL